MNFPYLLNATLYPSPDQLSTAGSNVTLPQVTVTSTTSFAPLQGLATSTGNYVGSFGSTYLYEMTYVQTFSAGPTLLQFSLGTLNVTAAGAILNHPGCGCTSNLPISWGSNLTVATFPHGVSVTGDAIASSGSVVVVAASTGTVTQTWFSESFGHNGSWVSLSEAGSTPGAIPKLALQGCTGLLTTISGGTTLEVTSLNLPCDRLLNVVTPGTQQFVSSSGGIPPPGPPSPPPTVTQVVPSSAYVGQMVTISGTNFASGAIAYFGGTAAFTTYISTTRLTAIVPSKISPKTTINVTVSVNGAVSAYNWPADAFTFLPSVVAVQSPEGQQGLVVNVTGIGFTVGLTATFGTVSAGGSGFVNSTLMHESVPVLASGTTVVDVSVGGPPHPGDQFTYVAASGTPITQNLVTSATPLFLHPTPNATTEAVIASYSSNRSIQLLTSSNGFHNFSTHWVASFNMSMGSPVLSNLGGTRIQIPSGTAGEVTAVSAGPYVFVAFTSRELDENALRTVVSNSSGTRWTAPYLAMSGNGSVDSPLATISPAGYVYLTWRANGQGGWSAEQRIFSDAGRSLSQVTAVPGTGGAAGSVTQSLSVAVDGWQRPLYVWSFINRTGYSVIDYTGAYLGVRQLTSLIWQSFNQTVPSDYRTFGSSQVATFEGQVTTSLTTVLSDLHSHNYAGAQTQIVADLYPYLTVNRTGYAFAAPASDPYACSGGLGGAATLLANSTGPYSTGTSFGVYAGWLVEASGCGALGMPRWPGVPGGSPVPISASAHQSGFPPPPVIGTILHPYSTPWGSVNITPVSVNPNAVLLSAQSTFTGNSSNSAIHVTGCRGFIDHSYYPAGFSEKILSPLGAATVGIYTSPIEVPSVYLTNLQPNSNGTWSVTISVFFNQTYTESKTCGGVASQQSGSEPAWLGPAKITFTLTGSYTTYLGTLPTPPPIKVDTNRVTNKATLYSNFTASVVAEVSLFSITEQGGGYYGSNSTITGATRENISLSNVPILGTSKWLWATFELNTSSDPANPSWPQVNCSQISHPTHALWANYTYEFQTIPNPVKLSLDSRPVANISATDASVAWNSSAAGTGWVRYQEAGAGQFQQTALMGNSTQSGYSHRYTLELHSLNPWSFYSILIGVDAVLPGNPVTYENYTAATFQTAAAVNLAEWEAPIDSITGEGGGALIYWNWPIDFGGFTYLNGSLSFWPSNQSRTTSQVVVPVPQLNQFTVGWNSGVNGVNLTGLNLNWTYAVSLSLNVSYQGKTLVVTNEPFVFQYARDSSGDGLTDWEKVRGWNVTTQLSPGSFQSSTVQANPKLYSTNGLTSDLLEKQFGLNPNTLSTTNDGMLDAWNLTFNLGPGSPALPASGFEYWYENSSYHFTQACPQPLLHPPCSFTPIYANITNLSDNGPGSSKVLWSGIGPTSALATLATLAAADALGPLRGMTGTYKGDRTLTVWGKLSWGADPLSWSTAGTHVGNGVPGDGSLVDPLGATDLNVTLTSWSMDGLEGGDGVAAFIHATSNATSYFPTGQTDYSSYSLSSTSPGGANSWYGPAFSINFQVAPNEQHATLNLSMVAARTGGSYIHDSPAPVYVDLENLSLQALRFSHSNYTLNLTYRVTPIFSKATTIVVIPGDNSTLSKLPIGLQRYVGEQNFILLALNDTVSGTSSLSVSGIPYVNSSATNGISTGAYRLNLSGGMNNILVPRSLFVHSPLGQELLLNRTNVSITSTSFNAFLRGSWDPATWQARALGYSNWNGSSYSAGTQGYVKIYSSTNQNCTTNLSQCGVVPANLPAGQQVPAYAVESIFALNVTSAAVFKNLLAGLLLNSTGNFTGWGFAATQYLPSLGLSTLVSSVLANSFVYNSGAYNAPVYQPPAQQPHGWQAVGPAIWNAFSGTVGALISVAWGWVQEAGSFEAYLAKEVVNWGLSALSQVVGVLKSVASAITYLIELLAITIRSFILGILSLIVTPIESALSAYVAGVSSALNVTMSDVRNGGLNNGQVSTAHGLALLDAISGAPMLAAAIIGGVIVVGLTVAAEVGFGAGFVLGILLSLIVYGALDAIKGPTNLAELSQAAVASLDSFFTSVIPANGGTAPQVNWSALGQSVGIAAGVVDLPVVSYLLYKLPENTGCRTYGETIVCTATWTLIAFEMAWGSLVFGGMAAGYHNEALSIIAAAFGGLGFGASLMALRYGEAPPGLKMFAALDTGLTLTGFGVGAAELTTYV